MFSGVKRNEVIKWGVRAVAIFLIIFAIFIGHMLQPKTSRISIQTNPKARVFINGSERGETPTEVETEEKEIILRLEFAESPPIVYQELVRPEKGTKVIVRREVGEGRGVVFGETIFLIKSGPQAASFITDPPGANVFLNDQLVGTSPLTIPRLAPGVYRVRVELLGYEPREFEIKVVEGFETRSLVELLRKV